MALEKSLIEDVSDRIEDQKKSDVEKDLEAKTKTPAQFLRDDKGKELFAQYLKDSTGNDPKAIETLAKYNSSDSSLDVQYFAEKAQEYGKKLASAERLAEKLSPEFMTRLGKLSPERFGKYVDLVGPDKMSEVWKVKLPELMVKDPAKFKLIEGAVNGFEATRDEGDRKIKEYAAKLGITSPERFAKAMAITDPKERAEALRPLLNTFWSNLLDMIPKAGDFMKGLNANKHAKRAREQIEQSIHELNTKMRSLVEPLVGLIEGSGGVAIGFKNVLFGSPVSPNTQQETSFTEARAIQWPSTADLDAQIQTDWTARKASLANWSTMNTHSRNAEAMKFKQEQREKITKDMSANVAPGKTRGVWVDARETLLQKHLDGITISTI